MTIQSMEAFELNQKRVLIREDFNVPMDDHGHITNEARILAALPTLQYALAQNARVIIMSHLGRPEEGEYSDAFSLKRVAEVLSRHLGKPVPLIKDCSKGVDVAPGDIVLLENVRFLKGENKNDPSLSKQLADLCDVFVMDAFAVSHRAQASTVGVATFAPKVCAGFLMNKELKALTQALAHPERPMVAIVGGAKVSTKITILDKLLDKVDCLIIGGGMANTFLKAKGFEIGASLVETDWVSQATALLNKAEREHKTILIPQDVVVARDFSGTPEIKSLNQIESQDKIFDIGPKTIEHISKMLKSAKTIVWNGPLGVFENPRFSAGTKAVAEMIANSNAFSLAGGGDTLAAIDQFGVSKSISYESTAGGAFLEFLEGRTLPGVEILEKRG